MKIIKLLKYTCDYVYKNIVLPKIMNFFYGKILKKNSILKNSKKGKRCFIIGGGSSINGIPLEILKDEDTIVMNEFDQHEKYKIIHPKNYCIFDTAYFTSPDDHYLTRQFLKKSESIPKDTNFFLNIRAKEFIQKKNLFQGNKIYFIGMQGIMSDKFKFNIQIDKIVPWPKNSILMCLMISVYMGYGEIYLLGCEHNFLSRNIGLSKSLTYEHSYEDEREYIDISNPELAKKYTVAEELNMTYEEQVAHVRQLLKNYRLFYQKVKKINPEIKIFNATPGSFLDVFPAVDFPSIHFSN